MTTNKEREQARERQRRRRARNPRIDYYPSGEALKAIRERSSRYAGGDYSSILNRIVTDWLADRGEV